MLAGAGSPGRSINRFGGCKCICGDINYDNLIDQLDLNRITAAFGSNDWSGGAWDAAADLDLNGKVDVHDLAIAGRSLGSQHNFHQARLLANNEQNVYRLDACIDGQDRVHVAWSDATYLNVYYTRLDRYGNTLIDDVLVDHGSSTGTDFVAIGCDADGNTHLIMH
jgi:hypothetical protein